MAAREQASVGKLAVALMRLSRRMDALEAALADLAGDACGADDADDADDGPALPADLREVLEAARNDPEVKRLVDNVGLMAGLKVPPAGAAPTDGGKADA